MVMRQELSLGLIETRGLIAAIEAADAAVKSADVKLLSLDRVDAGLVTVKMVGEISAVQAAVAAGAAAAQRIGQFIGSHVIARPDAELNELLIYTVIDSRRKKQPLSATVERSHSPSSEPIPSTHIQSEFNESETAQMDAADFSLLEESEESDNRLSMSVPVIVDEKSLASMSVPDLRRFARTIEGLPIQGREISRADKQTLIDIILRLDKKA
jgi:ethanolamine utilization protein EutM